MTAPTVTDAPAGAPALADAPVCETVESHALTGARIPCGEPAVVADLIARTCGCVPTLWSYSCALCAVEGGRAGYGCLYCLARTVRVLCRVPVGRG